jgi:hypothetical protein
VRLLVTPMNRKVLSVTTRPSTELKITQKPAAGVHW